jgi:hypothetical protein
MERPEEEEEEEDEEDLTVRFGLALLLPLLLDTIVLERERGREGGREEEDKNRKMCPLGLANYGFSWRAGREGGREGRERQDQA